MLNYIWFALMAIALVVAIFTGTAPAVTKGAIDSARTAVEIALGLVGIMTLWLGIMRVAEAAGLISLLGRMLRPFSRVLFPEIPPEHPAIGAMILNVAANMLGLSNAATPLGIKAMEELQTLNDEKDKETATDAMVTFMALNTAGIQLIPATIIGVLAAAGSKNPTAIIVTTIVATFAGAVAAVTAAKILQRFFPRPPMEPRLQPLSSPADAGAPSQGVSE
ncbi:MAG TPA: nucleoside recognition domain-containing protein [Thermoanaerobaculia bacterium]|nr:nucleoside recognition domain-containing protein [Thermoanaerobaculia bacterium]